MVLLWLAPAASAIHVTQIIDATGDMTGTRLGGASGIAVDLSGNVYVTATGSYGTGAGGDDVFQITPSGTITEIIEDRMDWPRFRSHVR